MRRSTNEWMWTLFSDRNRLRARHSLGFVSISHETPVVILGHADQALYYAKANGRNRVCHYDELVSSGKLHTESQSESSVEFFFDEPTLG